MGMSRSARLPPLCIFVVACIHVQGAEVCEYSHEEVQDSMGSSTSRSVATTVVEAQHAAAFLNGEDAVVKSDKG